MPALASLAEFRQAVADFPAGEFEVAAEPAARAEAERSLAESGFLLLGELHGARESPLIIRAWLASFGLTGLALEWPAELAPVISAFLAGDIDGYRIVYRDSGGPVSGEERAFFAASPGCDLAIVGFIGRPLMRRQLREATMPLIETYQPRAVIPCHHDDLYPVFIDLATEPLKMGCTSSSRRRAPSSRSTSNR